jgi:hypothetical protein
MAELNLNQKLASERRVHGRCRKLVFGSTQREFAEDIDALSLQTQVLHLRRTISSLRNTSWCAWIRIELLVYGFLLACTRDNHRADTLMYSGVLCGRASLLSLDLGIDERFKPVVQHLSSFCMKDRTQNFYDLVLESFNRSTMRSRYERVVLE